MGNPIKDLTGQRFGKWTVLEHVGSNKYKNATWLCQCDCGSTPRVVVGSSLCAGRSQSCSCSAAPPGMSRVPIYELWKRMLARCNNPKVVDYKYYGGRGIKVCPRWHDFANLYADMGVRPSPQHSIDRIDNDGDYEPGNCRWATKAEQTKNTRRARRAMYKGKILHLKEWAEELGISYKALEMRWQRGYRNEALFTVRPTTKRRVIG